MTKRTKTRINKWIAREAGRGRLVARLVTLDEDGAGEAESVTSVVLTVIRYDLPLQAEWIALGDPDEIDDDEIRAELEQLGLEIA